MTKKLFICIWLYLLPVMLFATESRVATLGGESVFLIDNTNIKYYPGLISFYPNTIFCEIKAPLQFIGLINFNKTGILGIGVSSDTMSGILNRIIEQAPFIRMENPSNIELYYGKSPIGIKVERRNYHYEDKVTNNTQYLDLLKGVLGTKYNYTSNLYLDIALSATKVDLESRFNYPSPITYKTLGNLSYGGNLRFVQTFTGKPDLFILGASYEKYDINCTKNSQDTVSFLSQDLSLFSSANYYPISNTLMLIGFKVGITKEEKGSADTTFIRSTISPEVVLGIENGINSWLTVRTGLKEKWSFVTTSMEMQEIIKEDNEILNSNAFDLYFGFGIQFNNFILDVRCTDLLFSTPVTGLSASYEF